MSYNLTLRETKWYIAVQDGPYDNRLFDTIEEAEAARQSIKSFSENEFNSTCVMNRIVEKMLLTE